MRTETFTKFVKVLLTQLLKGYSSKKASSPLQLHLRKTDAIWNFDSGNRAIMSEENSLTTVAFVDTFLFSRGVA
jgi:hypothetical protein